MKNPNQLHKSNAPLPLLFVHFAVCNFVVHDRCMKTVVSPCSSIATYLIKVRQFLSCESFKTILCIHNFRCYSCIGSSVIGAENHILLCLLFSVLHYRSVNFQTSNIFILEERAKSFFYVWIMSLFK